MAEHWRVAGCSPGQSSLAVVPAGFCNIYAYVIYLSGLTPCALNGLPHHGIQEQGQSSISRRTGMADLINIYESGLISTVIDFLVIHCNFVLKNLRRKRPFYKIFFSRRFFLQKVCNIRRFYGPGNAIFFPADVHGQIQASPPQGPGWGLHRHWCRRSLSAGDWSQRHAGPHVPRWLAIAREGKPDGFTKDVRGCFKPSL